MRISTSQLFRQGVGAINDSQTQIARTQNQLGSGQRILRPSDDPSGATEALRLAERIDLTAQFGRNIDYARGRLAQEEGALANAIDVLQRVRELSISANNEGLLLADRRAIKAEVEQRLAELVDLSNSRDATGEFIFSGFQGRTRPFTQDAAGTVSYAGDQGQRQVQIGTDHSVGVGDHGFDTFVAVRNGNGTFAVAPNAANAGAGIIDPGDVQDLAAYDGDSYTVVMARDSGVTGGAIALNDTGTNDALTYELRINGTLVDTLGEGDSRTLNQLEAAIDAAAGATGVQAHVDGGRLFLNATTPGTNIVVTETLAGASEDTDTVTGFFGNALTGLTTPTATSDLSGDADGFVVLDSGGTIETSGTFSATADIVFSGIRTRVGGEPRQGDTFSVTPSVNQSVFATVANLVADLERDGAVLDNALNRAQVDINRALENLNAVRTTVGARLNTLDSQQSVNADVTLELRTSLAALQDLDYAEAASVLNRQLLVLQAAQQAFVRIQGLSLFNFLG